MELDLTVYVCEDLTGFRENLIDHDLNPRKDQNYKQRKLKHFDKLSASPVRFILFSIPQKGWNVEIVLIDRGPGGCPCRLIMLIVRKNRN
jgi:hypothetical protein